jgi:hypothetical protein
MILEYDSIYHCKYWINFMDLISTNTKNIYPLKNIYNYYDNYLMHNHFILRLIITYPVLKNLIS